MPRWSERLVLLLLAAVLLPGATSAVLARPTAHAEAAGVIIERYVAPMAASSGQSAPAALVPAVPARALYTEVQAIALYGAPNTPIMGALGQYTPDDAARAVVRLAAEWDAINGDRGAIGVLHLITAVAQPHPMRDGSYLLRLGPESIGEYVEAARAHGVLLILDVQVGMAEPLAEAQRLEPFLREPFVHLALDPEFATQRYRRAPGSVIGTLDVTEIRPVQAYLARIAVDHNLPPKILVLHQFTPKMLVDLDALEASPDVDVVVDMDGFGGKPEKLGGYNRYARAAYSEYAGFKLFFHWDTPVFTASELMALESPPRYIVYQ